MRAGHGENRFFLVDKATNTIVNSCWTTTSWARFDRQHHNDVAEWRENPPSVSELRRYDDAYDESRR